MWCGVVCNLPTELCKYNIMCVVWDFWNVMLFEYFQQGSVSTRLYLWSEIFRIWCCAVCTLLVGLCKNKILSMIWDFGMSCDAVCTPLTGFCKYKIIWVIWDFWNVMWCYLCTSNSILHNKSGPTLLRSTWEILKWSLLHARFHFDFWNQKSMTL